MDLKEIKLTKFYMKGVVSLNAAYLFGINISSDANGIFFIYH